MPAMGSLAPTSIFKPEVELAGYRDDMTPEEKERLRETEAARKERLEKEKNLRLQGYVLDPDPKKRELWERRKGIEGIQRRGRVTRDVKLARTERELRWKSINFQTSTKKLTKLMNQIAGKTMEEALVQMRFSKKRVARDVVKGLLMARDEAIVRSGMGLGSVKPTPIKEVELEQKEDESEEDFEARKAAVMAAKAAALEERLLSPGTYLRAKPEDAITIELKDGTRKKVCDPTEIYIDQAWVGKGESWRSIECRARGMTNLLRHRTTSKANL
jgi:ribosomal protein L22